MTFDQWVDAVNVQLRARLGGDVRTQELSWDSAYWVGKGGNAVAALEDDGTTARLTFDGGEHLALDLSKPEAEPAVVTDVIAQRLAAR